MKIIAIIFMLNLGTQDSVRVVDTCDYIGEPNIYYRMEAGKKLRKEKRYSFENGLMVGFIGGFFVTFATYVRY